MNKLFNKLQLGGKQKKRKKHNSKVKNRARGIKKIRDQRQAEEQHRAKIEQKTKLKAERRKRIEIEAYLLWETNGKPVDRDNYYWEKATERITRKDANPLYKLYYLLEQIILEPFDLWIKKQALISILSQLTILAAIIAFIGGEKTRRNNEVFAAWQTITSAQEQSGSGGRIEALEFLNSRPWRFPWIGFTEKGWYLHSYWDENEQKEKKKCKQKRLYGQRWERQDLVGLLAPMKAYLAEIHLCGANLRHAKLSGAYLREAGLTKADLRYADLRNTDLTLANLKHTNLESASLIGANLKHADLSYANLYNTRLGATKLRDAELRYADLTDAKLICNELAGEGYVPLPPGHEKEVLFLGKCADLGNADLTYANLRGADFNGAQNLTIGQVKSACYWENASFDPEFEEELNQESNQKPNQEFDCSYYWKQKN